MARWLHVFAVGINRYAGDKHRLTSPAGCHGDPAGCGGRCGESRAEQRPELPDDRVARPAEGDTMRTFVSHCAFITTPDICNINNISIILWVSSLLT